MKLALVIPCYNEAAGLPELMRRCFDVTSSCDADVILVDNGSTDDTPKLLPSLLKGHARMRSVRVEVNQGYGRGILAGLHAADADILAWTHADLQTDPMDVVEGLRLFQQAPDPETLFVKGRRFGRPLADVVFTIGMSAFETMLLQRGLWDINAQPTMMPRSFFQTWHEPPEDFSLDLYAYYTAKLNGLSIERFPVRFGERAHGMSHWNVDWRAKAKFIRRTVDYSLELRSSLGRQPAMRAQT
ncbi:MAG: glycosyltransferase family 2 protein [Pseudomonadota bacterium]